MFVSSICCVRFAYNPHLYPYEAAKAMQVRLPAPKVFAQCAPEFPHAALRLSQKPSLALFVGFVCSYEAKHLFLQLRVHFVGDGHNVREQLTEF